MKISKNRFDELGLGCDKMCIYADKCPDFDRYEIADCLDEQRLQQEMTDEEYDAYRHNRLEVEI